MPMYKMSASQSGGFRILLPPDPRPPSKFGKILGYVLTFAVGLAGGILLCALPESRNAGSQYYNAPAKP